MLGLGLSARQITSPPPPPHPSNISDWVEKGLGAFFWNYSGIGTLGIDGICVLLGAIPFSEWMEYHSVHSALDSRMNRIEGMRFTGNRQNMRSFGKCLAGNPTWPPASVACADTLVLMSPPILFPDLKRVGAVVGAFFSKLKFRVFCYS